jgi:hypothetical protein
MAGAWTGEAAGDRGRSGPPWRRRRPSAAKVERLRVRERTLGASLRRVRHQLGMPAPFDPIEEYGLPPEQFGRSPAPASRALRIGPLEWTERPRIEPVPMPFSREPRAGDMAGRPTELEVRLVRDLGRLCGALHALGSVDEPASGALFDVVVMGATGTDERARVLAAHAVVHYVDAFVERAGRSLRAVAHEYLAGQVRRSDRPPLDIAVDDIAALDSATVRGVEIGTMEQPVSTVELRPR